MRPLLFLLELGDFLIHLPHRITQLRVILILPRGHLRIPLAVHAKLDEDDLRKLHNFAELSFLLILPYHALNFLEGGDEAIDRVKIADVLILDALCVDGLRQPANKSMKGPSLSQTYIRSTASGSTSFPYFSISGYISYTMARIR